MYAWMQVCVCHANLAERSEPTPHSFHIPYEVESEIVLILASMAMHSPATM
jgi:hypothetical protein